MSLLHEIRSSLVTLWRRPGSAIAVVFVLALATGPNIAVFDMVHDALLAPLPYPDAEDVVVLYSTNPEEGWEREYSSYQNVLDWMEGSTSFEAMAAWSEAGVNLAGDRGAARVGWTMVSPGFFETFGLDPMIGRTFTDAEQQPGRGDVVVIAHRFWQSYFGSSPDVIGKTLEVNDKTVTVIGVMPPAMAFPSVDTDMWQPIARTPDATGDRGDHWINAIGRLKADVTIERARAELSAIASRLESTYPDSNRGWGVNAFPLRVERGLESRTALLGIWGAVIVVLLIATFNVANLLLVRTSRRSREFAVRRALGADPARIAAHLLSESVILAAVAGVVGLGVAWALGRALDMSGTVSSTFDGSLGARTVLYSAGLSLVIGLLLGGFALIRVLRTNDVDAMRHGSRGTGDRRQRRSQNAILAGEVALTVALLTGALLLVRTLSSVMANDPGFDVESVVTFRTSPPITLVESDEGMAGFVRQFAEQRGRAVSLTSSLQQRLGAVPGVESVGAVNSLPMTGKGWWQPVETDVGTDEEPSNAVGRVIVGDYFRAMGIPLIQGRSFAVSDTIDSEPVAIVGKTLASTLWPGELPIGKRVRIGGPEQIFKWMTVVGVAGDVRHGDLTSTPEPAIYVPMTQAWFGFFQDFGLSYVVKGRVDAEALTPVVRKEMKELAPELPVYGVTTLRSVIRDVSRDERRNALLVGTFAALALALSLVGIYAVTSNSVTTRTREIGIRAALGASRWTLLKGVLVDGLKTVVVGIVAGGVIAFACARFISGLLHGVEAGDVPTLVLASTCALVTSLAANLVPALRASRIDPKIALQEE